MELSSFPWANPQLEAASMCLEMVMGYTRSWDSTGTGRWQDASAPGKVAQSSRRSLQDPPGLSSPWCSVIHNGYVGSKQLEGTKTTPTQHPLSRPMPGAQPRTKRIPKPHKTGTLDGLQTTLPPNWSFSPPSQLTLGNLDVVTHSVPGGGTPVPGYTSRTPLEPKDPPWGVRENTGQAGSGQLRLPRTQLRLSLRQQFPEQCTGAPGHQDISHQLL